MTLAFVAASGVANAASPDPELTPGQATITVSQANMAATICVRGYTSRVRDVSSTTRTRVFNRYHVKFLDRHLYVIDHLIPLELGGANTLANLWPQPVGDAHAKDGVEESLHVHVCAGHVDLSAAQHAIASNWQNSEHVATHAQNTADATKARADAQLQAFYQGLAQKRLNDYYLGVQRAREAAASRRRASTRTTPRSTGGSRPALAGGGATARCNDGTYSYAAHRQGACSHHGGVATFYK